MNTIIGKYLYAIILFALVISLTIFTIFKDSTMDKTHSYSIIVHEGDSLWSIAETYAKQLNMSTMEVVHLFETENQLGYESIKIGDTLSVPKQVVKKLPNETHFVYQAE